MSVDKYSFEDIKDQVVVITGSGRGIGKSVAETFANQGAKVVISDIDEDVCNEAVEDIKKQGGDAIGVVADISKEDQVANLMKAPVDKWEKIDCLVNNAGITKDGLFLRMNLEQWRTVLDINLTGTYLCAKECVKYMRKAKKGSIINISSIARMGNPGQANYSAAKAGIVGLTSTLAKELGPLGIRVNAIAPGFIRTRLTDAIPDKISQEIQKRISLGRIGVPKEIANPILFLASKMASYINGQVLDVNGCLGM